MKRRDRAVLVIHQKLTSPSTLLREIIVWKRPKSERYPEGVRYRLVLVDPASGAVLLLFDNHWPKGHHCHEEGDEHPYRFTTLTRLILDFRARSDFMERKYREGKKDKDPT